MGCKTNPSLASAFGAPGRTSLAVGVGVAAVMTALACARAQQAPAAGPEQGEDVGVLETITVTAVKRERSLQDTPVAVSVVGADAIEKAEIQDLNDLQSLVPSFAVGQRGSTGNTNFFIRGFGNGANNAGIEPSVGVFIDGVYRSRSSAQIVDLPSLERVEVLRGPQSTLFGKNASVGVVSIVTKTPEFEFGGLVSATGGNFGTARIRGDITGPIADTVAFRVSGSFNRRNGYAGNLETGGDINDRDRWGVRGQLLFEPTETVSLRLTGDYDKIDESCCLSANIVSGPATDATLPVLGRFVDEDPFSYTGFANFDPINEIENAGVSLHADKEFDGFVVSSITAYRTVDSFTLADADSSSVEIITSQNDGRTETFTQELRLTSTTDGPIEWMVGGFFFQEDLRVDGEFLYRDDFRSFVDILSAGGLATVEALLGLPVGQTFFQSGQGPVEARGQDNRSWSLFGTLDWHVTDRVTASVGLNYTADRKAAFLRQVNTDVFSGLDLVAVGVGLGLGPEQAQDPAFNPVLALRALQFNPPFLDFPNVVEDGRSRDDKLTYSFRLAYDVTDSINVYGSYATGFKATSWNLSRDSRPFPEDFIPGSPVTNPPPSPIRDAGLAVNNLTTGTRFAGPEDVDVFEIGLKAQFDRVAFNLALFDQTVEGFQSAIFTGTGFAFSNAGKQTTRGVELDATWVVFDALTLGLAGTYLDAEYDSFENSPFGDLSGQRPVEVPEYTLSTFALYEFYLGDWPAFLRADWQRSRGARYFDSPDNQALIGFERDFDLVNASMGVSVPYDVEVVVWARNIFGEEYITAASVPPAQSGSISGFANQPRTWGATVRKRF